MSYYQVGNDHFLGTGPYILLPELWIEIFTRLSQVQDCHLLDLSCDLCFPKCICSLSELNIYQDDLCSLCLTCKYFYNLASQPSLWYSIITIIVADSHHQYSPNSSYHSLDLQDFHIYLHRECEAQLFSFFASPSKVGPVERSALYWNAV